MGILDRTRDALRPANTIEPIENRPPGRGAPGATASPGPAPEQAAPVPAGYPPGAQAGKRPALAATDPESIARAYYVQVQRGERRYYDDYQGTALAIRASDTAISSKRQDLNTVRAMLELAEARGWQSLEIRGSPEFRREMWIEANARGLKARGHTVSDLDRQEALRRGAERAPVHPPRAPATATPPRAPAAAPVRAAEKSQQPAAQAAAKPAAPTDPERAGRTEQAVEEHRKTLRHAGKELSQDGRLLLAALSEKIDRQMNRLHSASKAELKAFVAVELVKKERSDGPIVLSAEQKRTASAPEPVSAPAKVPSAPTRSLEPQAPQRSLSR